MYRESFFSFEIDWFEAIIAFAGAFIIGYVTALILAVVLGTLLDLNIAPREGAGSLLIIVSCVNSVSLLVLIWINYDFEIYALWVKIVLTAGILTSFLYVGWLPALDLLKSFFRNRKELITKPAISLVVVALLVSSIAVYGSIFTYTESAPTCKYGRCTEYKVDGYDLCKNCRQKNSYCCWNHRNSKFCH